MEDLHEPGPDDVVAAAETAYQLFATLAGLDWSATAGDLEWDCRQTLEHVTTVQIFLANNAANESRSRLPGARANNPDQSIPELVTLHRALANVLAAVLRSMPEDARGFHPAGLADRHGFAAMACTETLVHAADIAEGLGLDFAPPPEIPEKALARLFPWVQNEGDPWQALLYAVGRMPLGAKERQAPNWWWHCAPLSEWDGTVKIRPA